MKLVEALETVLALARKMALTAEEKEALVIVEQYMKKCDYWKVAS